MPGVEKSHACNMFNYKHTRHMALNVLQITIVMKR